MQNWQEWRKEIREERRESPVENFALLLVLAWCCGLGICCGVYAFFFDPYDFNCDCGICVMGFILKKTVILLLLEDNSNGKNWLIVVLIRIIQGLKSQWNYFLR